MKKVLVKALTITCSTAFLFGCGALSSDKNCDSKINDLTDKQGNPEEIDKYDNSDGYHSYKYWYWSRGISWSFTWGGPVESCKTASYTFTPIRDYEYSKLSSYDDGREETEFGYDTDGNECPSEHTYQIPLGCDHDWSNGCVMADIPYYDEFQIEYSIHDSSEGNWCSLDNEATNNE